MRRFLLWALIGALSISAVMLADIGRILADVESDGQRAFGPQVFTGLKLIFWNTADLSDAIALWRTSESTSGSTFGVLHLLRWHLLLDAIVFAPAYCLLILYGLQRLGASSIASAWVSLSVLLLDEGETWATWAILIGGKLSDVARVQLVLLQGLSLLKWCALAAAAVIAFVLWRTPDGVSLDSFRQFLRTLRTGKAQHPVAAMAGILLVTALFVALVAMPAGGPLNQIPDVLRRQLEGHDGDWSALWSAAAVMQLAACSGLAAWWVTNPRHAVPRPPDTASWKIVTGVAVMALALTAVASLVDGALRVVPLATLVVALSIWGAAIVARLTGVAAVPMPTDEQRQDERRHDGLEAPDSERALWAGGVAGAVLVATGLGLVRAAFPPFVLGLRSGRVDWSVALLAGIVLALAGGFVAQLLATGAHPRLAGNDARATRRRHAMRAVVGLIAATTLAFAGVLAIHPEQAVVWGTTGVIAIGYAVAILAIGGLTWISRARAGWEATYAIGVGWRTPWLTLVLLTWGVASVLNTEGIYHDARLRSELGPSTLRHRSPADAFDAWLASQRSECTGGAPGEIPMVLVAAPGGGIRAAYWTAAVLDSLFGGSTDECTLRRLFAISGVSGGSVGAATWLVARAAERSGTAAVERLAGDRALASTAAGLLLRDVYQPFTGISTAWSDRAALLEDGWVAASQPYLSSSAESGIGGRWSQLGGGLPWVPIVMLNSSSVNDGCRLLISNTGELASTHGSPCGNDQHDAIGSISTATQPILNARARAEEGGENCDAPQVGLTVATAALLSARFPLVSPSGAVVHCVAEQKPFADSAAVRLVPNVSYAVDGGYYENSGILTLLQLWSEVEPLVRRSNRAASQSRPIIVPWIVVVDNHYRSAARIAARGRPYELLAPVRSLRNKRILGQAALEEMARLSMRPTPERCARSSAGSSSAGDGAVTITSDSLRREDIARGCFVVIAPAKRPSVGAPLGWVLSSTSMSDLQSQLRERMQSGRSGVDRSLERLLTLLGGGEKDGR